jgi:hypothetical protein
VEDGGDGRQPVSVAKIGMFSLVLNAPSCLEIGLRFDSPQGSLGTLCKTCGRIQIGINMEVGSGSVSVDR